MELAVHIGFIKYQPGLAPGRRRDSGCGGIGNPESKALKQEAYMKALGSGCGLGSGVWGLGFRVG